MLIYILMILLTFLFWFDANKQRNIKLYKKYFIILCVVFTAVSFFRFNVGTDYLYTYVYKYNIIKLSGNDAHFELLFYLLVKLFILFKISPIVLIQLCSLVTIPLFFNFIYNNLKKEYWFMGVLIFMISTIYFATMNTIRQYLAISIILYAYKYLKEQKYKKYFLFLLLACGFHYSSILAIIPLVFNFFFKEGKKDKILLVFYLVSLFLFFLDTNKLLSIIHYISPSKYKYFFDLSYFPRNNMAFLKIIVPNILLILLFINKEKIKKYDKSFYLYFIPFLFYIIIYNVFYGLELFKRVILYYECFIILIIPVLTNFYKNNPIKIKKHKINNSYKIFALCNIGYYLVLTIYRIFLTGGHQVVPYMSIFSLFNF